MQWSKQLRKVVSSRRSHRPNCRRRLLTRDRMKMTLILAAVICAAAAAERAQAQGYGRSPNPWAQKYQTHNGIKKPIYTGEFAPAKPNGPRGYRSSQGTCPPRGGNKPPQPGVDWLQGLSDIGKAIEKERCRQDQYKGPRVRYQLDPPPTFVPDLSVDPPSNNRPPEKLKDPPKVDLGLLTPPPSVPRVDLTKLTAGNRCVRCHVDNSTGTVSMRKASRREMQLLESALNTARSDGAGKKAIHESSNSQKSPLNLSGLLDSLTKNANK